MTSKSIMINKEEFWVKDDEYTQVYNEEFCNLNILNKLGEHERIVSLLRELSLCSNKELLPNLISSCITHGGYVELQVSKYYNVIEGIVGSNEDYSNLEKNRRAYDVGNISVFSEKVWGEMILDEIMEYIVFLKEGEQKNQFLTQVLDRGDQSNSPIFILLEEEQKNEERIKKINKNYKIFYLSRSNYQILVHYNYLSKFESYFIKYISESCLLDYDNLIHLTMIVKNAGDSFVDVLRANLDIIDEYTILDTGSTDNTLEILREVLKDKRGNIYEEPFINFRDSRNRCMDLAGDRCKFMIMLDDTYIVKNNLRLFLETVRGDQFSDSFSLYIHSDDVEYGSNRIIKSATKLRYKYKLHEVITPFNNKNVIIPKHHGSILDFRSDYMEERTMDRKEYDLKILYEMVDEDPDDSRAYYYLGQTYNLLKNHTLAFDNFLKRLEHKDEGFIQEKIDACFEAARLANFYLNKSWEESEALYFRAYEMDKSRPDSLYFIGIHYYLEKNYEKAYGYFKEAFNVGYPAHCQYSLKPTLSYYYLPKFLVEVCYYVKDFGLGLKVSQYFLDNYDGNLKNMKKEAQGSLLQSDLYTMQCWKKIYLEFARIIDKKKQMHLMMMSGVEEIIEEEEEVKKKLVFVVNGGFNEWRGSDIETKGMGGSETFIVEISKYISLSNKYDVVVFCNCATIGGEIYYGVIYKPLNEYCQYIVDNEVDTVVVSRYPEYLPVLYESANVKNVYLILHDLIPEGEIIMRHSKLRKILALSDYHVNFLNGMFPSLSDLTEKFEYGIDIDKFMVNKEVEEERKVKNRFIYSSFANRGLLNLLEMWRDIRKVLDGATLHIHCDIENKWVNSVSKGEMDKIRGLLFDLKEEGIVYRGWTSKKELSLSWKQAEVWFYTTTFLETFCLTALEAAVSQTLAVTFPIGSLVETVGDRGLLLNRNVLTVEGREIILGELFSLLLGDNKRREELIKRNYIWGQKKAWSERGAEFLKIIIVG